MNGSIGWAAAALAVEAIALAALVHFKHILDFEDRQVEAIWH